MKHRYLNKNIKYDGTQLRSHFIFENTELLGDAIVAFSGAADVPLKNMVDLADVKAKAPIFSTSMLHFIVEHFNMDLTAAVLGQRLLGAIITEELNRKIKTNSIHRRADDLFDGDRKLSVSIATVSPVSCLIHYGINIISDKTPVPTKGLADYNIEPQGFANAVMQRYIEEINSANSARYKVRPVT